MSAFGWVALGYVLGAATVVVIDEIRYHRVQAPDWRALPIAEPHNPDVIALAEWAERNLSTERTVH